MDALETILTRRSVRTYTGQPVSDETVETLLRAAMHAPSAHNQQPWHFVVVRDSETRRRLAEATRYAAPMGRAPVGIVVFADTSALKTPEDLWVVDCAAAVQNLLLAARAEGVGSVWMAVWPIHEYIDRIRAILGAPAEAVPVAMVAVGYPDKPLPEVDRFRPERVHAEHWGG